MPCNETTNKQWLQRLHLIQNLSDWVYHNLNSTHTTWGSSTDKKATARGRKKKAMQYVVEHLSLGKMLFTFEKVDPLFTEQAYNDESMQLQLKPNIYPMFQALIRRNLVHMREFNPQSYHSVSWNEAVHGIEPTGMKRLAQLRASLCQNTNLSQSQIDLEMIGLVLRYKCMSAFDSNYHGSIPSKWGELLSHYHECFASPLNHKFATYYSIFEEDTVFGSKGNFFAMARNNNDSLPPGYYEINPPWMNACYEMIEWILRRSVQNNINVILIGPSWQDTKWIPKLNALTHKLSNAFAGCSDDFVFFHDMNGKNFALKTMYWVISSSQSMPVALFNELGLNYHEPQQTTTISLQKPPIQESDSMGTLLDTHPSIVTISSL